MYIGPQGKEKVPLHSPRPGSLQVWKNRESGTDHGAASLGPGYLVSFGYINYIGQIREFLTHENAKDSTRVRSPTPFPVVTLTQRTATTP